MDAPQSHHQGNIEIVITASPVAARKLREAPSAWRPSRQAHCSAAALRAMAADPGGRTGTFTAPATPRNRRVLAVLQYLRA